MNSSHHRWLHQQLTQWQNENLLSTETVGVLRGRYPVAESGVGLSQIIMGALGALLIGTGLIAVIGYNWDDFSRPVRLAFGFGPLLLAQVLSFLVLQRNKALPTWVRETTALFQTLGAGACLAVVSQIYNLGGKWTDFLFVWCLFTLPLGWIMRSTAVTTFYLISIAVWCAGSSWSHQPWHQGPMLYPLLLLGIFPFWPGLKLDQKISTSMRWILASTASFGLAWAAGHAASFPQHLTGNSGEIGGWYLALTASAMALFPLTREDLISTVGRKPQVILGFLGLLIFGIVCSFIDPSEDMARALRRAFELPWTWLLLAINATFGILAVRQQRWAVLSVAALAFLPVFAVIIGLGSLLSWIMNLYLAAMGLVLILLEFKGMQGAPRLGAALLCCLIVARMLESDISLLAKGIAFILIGIVFLAFNIFIACHHRKSASRQS